MGGKPPDHSDSVALWKIWEKFVTSILQQAREKEVLSIVNDQIGSPTYTADLAKAISVLIRYDAQGIFHVANSDLCYLVYLWASDFETFGINRVKVIPISSKEFGRPAVRPSYSVLNCQKLKKETGLALRSWSEALKDYLTTYRLEISGEGR